MAGCLSVSVCLLGTAKAWPSTGRGTQRAKVSREGRGQRHDDKGTLRKRCRPQAWEGRGGRGGVVWVRVVRVVRCTAGGCNAAAGSLLSSDQDGEWSSGWSSTRHT